MNSTLISLGSFILSCGTLAVAILALQSWKKQFNKSLQRDFVLATLDAIHQISKLNFKIVGKFNEETEKNEHSLLNSEYFPNPIHVNHSYLLEEFSQSISNLEKSLNHLNKLQDEKYFDELSEKYLECVYEIGMFFQYEQLVGFDHPDITEMDKNGLTTSWLDKACDRERFLEMQIEDYLIKLLKI